MTAAQLADYKKIKAELRGARLEIDFRNKAAAFLRGGSLGKNTIRLPFREEGNYPTRLMCHCLDVSHSGLLHLGAAGGMLETCEAP